MRGWSKVVTSAMSGIPRGMLPWKDLTGDRWVGVGTTEKLYVVSGQTAHDITPIGYTTGAEDAVASEGFGGGAFGGGTYGGPRVLPDVIPASTWSLDNWGEYLVACASHDGKIYEWRNDTGVKAVLIDNAPVDCNGCLVTSERHLVAFGASGNPRLVAWSDSEDNTVWSPLPTNEAGDLEVQTQGSLIGATKLRGETLLFTEVDTHVMRHIGGQLVYGIESLSKASGLAGPKAAVRVDRGCYWMGQNGFFYYDGAVRPLPCEVSDYVFSDINLTQISKVYASHVSAYGEVWWFYPCGDSNEIDRYVIYNYREGHWMIGSGIARTCWSDTGVYDYPLACDAAGFLYSHEFGWTDNGTAIGANRYIRSGPVEITPGNRIMHVRHIIPDEKTLGEAQMTLHSKYTPEAAYVDHGPYTLAEYTSARISGRQVAIGIQGNVDGDWRFGMPRLDVAPGGRR